MIKFLRNMTSEQRNRIGFISVLLLATILNGFAYPIVYLREYLQSKHGGFPLEIDDLKRYSVATIIGSFLNLLLISIVLFIITL